MYKIGMCSVTFRDLTAGKVIEVAKQAGLEGIEWGGDVHVPPGDLRQAKKVRVLTEDAEMDIVSYGSYYRLGYEKNEHPFEVILETAKELNAPAIRVWAGHLGSEEASDEHRSRVAKDARRIADIAAKKDISINLEYHRGTLTDTVESTTQLLEVINHSKVFSYWQPAHLETLDEKLDSIDKIKPWLTHVHVFQWRIENEKLIRHPFEKGTSDWRQYLERLQKENGNRYLLMEFVKDNQVDQLLEDVEVLKTIMF